MFSWSCTAFARPRAALRLCLMFASLLVILWSPSAFALSADSVPALKNASAEGVLMGVVRDSAARPLSNVQVVVSSVNRSAMTDDKGAFVIRGLPPGSYHLNLVRIGYVAEHELVEIPREGAVVRVAIVMRVATVRLSSVNVTATPNGSDPLNVTQSSVQLAGKELQRSLSTSIGATLSNEPGMSSRFNGPMANAPVIRGLTGERVLVLQDGDRAGDLSSAAADHLNAVDPSSAERIEVIRGAASLLYGNNAIGGVVNVISSDIPTSIPRRATGYVVGQGESVAPGGVMSGGTTVPLGSQFALTARGGIRQFDNMRVGGGTTQDNTHGRTDNATLGGGYVGDHESVGVVFRQMNFEYGLPYAPGGEAVRLEGQRRLLALQSNIGTHFAPLSSIKIDGTVQRYTHSEIEPTGEVGTRFALNTQTANVTARTLVGRVKGALGVQGLFRQYTPTGDEAFTPGSLNNNVAAFVFQEFPISKGNEEQRAQLQVGARIDHFALTSQPKSEDERSRFGDPESRTYNNVAASVGLSVPVARDISLTANVSRGFRAPTVEELFANGFHAAVGTFDVGNRTLAPEQSTGAEVGVRAQSSKTFAQLGAYYNRIDAFIHPVAVGTREVDASTVPLVNYQQHDAALYGVEGQAEVRLPAQLVGGVMGDVTRARFRTLNQALPYIPAARLGASLRFDNGTLSIGADARRVFAQSRVSGDALDVATDAYTLAGINATVLFTARGSTVHSVTLRADNVFDARYRDATSRIKSFAYNPGRNASVVYKLLY